MSDIFRVIHRLGDPVTTPPGASAYMRDFAAAIGSTRVFKERDALKLVEEPLKRLKAALAEDRVAFVFEALATFDSFKALPVELALRGIL